MHADGTDRIGVWTIILPELLKYLKDTEEDTKIRQRAASALGKWGGKKEAQKLANILLSEPGKDESLKIACIEALKTIGGIEAVKALVKIAANKNELIDVRYAAVCDLEELGAGGWVDITDKPAPPPRKNITTDEKIRETIETLDKISKDSDEPSYFRYQAEDALAYLEQSFSFQLVDVSYWRQESGVAKAKVTIQTPEGNLCKFEEETASAAIEAVFTAINECFPTLKPCLTGYTVNSDVEVGAESLAKVMVTVSCDNQSNYSKIAENADTIWASADAYLQAVNDIYYGVAAEESSVPPPDLHLNSLIANAQSKDNLGEKESQSPTNIRLLNVSYWRQGSKFAKAKVTIQTETGEEWESPVMAGYGPIEAVSKAIDRWDRFQNFKVSLTSFAVKFEGEAGAHSSVTVTVRIKANVKVSKNHSSTTAQNIDTIWASADAYLQALIGINEKAQEVYPAEKDKLPFQKV
nr:alpha-isopropylmalate synthase regulatory domain-containing protein [Argonema antarcticum]